MTYSNSEPLIPKHGGYRTLKSFQMSTVAYDLTVEFCNQYVRENRMKDQMVQAARSGRQNIAEGCQASGTSKKTEIKLVNVARASLEELLLDYEDFLRQHGFPAWTKNDTLAQEVRKLVYRTDWSYMTYRTYFTGPGQMANVAICVIHQANYLLDQQLRTLEADFLEHGGFTERLYNMRKQRQ